MIQRLDRTRDTQRRQFIASLLFAANDAAALSDKCQELISRVQALAGGHDIGDFLQRDLLACLDSLGRARSLLGEAAQTAQSIEVTAPGSRPPAVW